MVTHSKKKKATYSRRNTMINGLPVRDAKSRVVIEVSRQDISSGKSKAPEACAAARACLRQIPHCTEARVHISRTFLKIGKEWFRYHTPEGMRLEIAAFDRGANFLPGVYVLTPMQPAKQTGRAQGSRPKNKPMGGKGKKRPFQHRLEGVRTFSST